MGKNKIVAAAPVAVQMADCPVIKGVTKTSFQIGGNWEECTFWGENLDADGLRAAVLDEWEQEIEYEKSETNDQYEIKVRQQSEEDASYEEYKLRIRIVDAPVGEHYFALTTVQEKIDQNSPCTSTIKVNFFS